MEERNQTQTHNRRRVRGIIQQQGQWVRGVRDHQIGKSEDSTGTEQNSQNKRDRPIGATLGVFYSGAPHGREEEYTDGETGGVKTHKAEMRTTG